MNEKKCHSWFVTFQEANMVKAGWPPENYKSPEWLANSLNNLWENSGKERTCAVAVCTSATGLYHAHIAAYSKGATTFNSVKKIFFDAHIEPQYGGKKELSDYIAKEGKYAEKGETVHFILNIENVSYSQGKRSDLDEIQVMIDAGMTPNEIMRENIQNRKFEKIIKGAYFDKRMRETPPKRDVNVIWHTGESRTGKSYTYVNLVKMHGEESVYLLSDYSIGGLDNYMGEPILFMDEFKGDLKFQLLLDYLEGYKKQIHCRYENAFALWTEVHITSIYAPDEVYDLMTQNVNRKRDSIEQLLKRISVIIYHYKKGGEYCKYEMNANKYVSYEDLKQRAFSDSNGFIPLETGTQTPFDKGAQN